MARTTLQAARTTIVTVNVAGKTATVTVNLSARTGVSITGPTTAISAGTPVTFSVGVGAAPAVNVRDVTIDFGDGSRSSLGAISTLTPVQHIYTEAGSFRASATATDSSGFTETVATFVTILPQQPPGVTIHAGALEPGPGSDGHLHCDSAGCDLHDSALRVDFRGRVASDGGFDWQPGNRDVLGNWHEGDSRSGSFSRPARPVTALR